MVGQRQWMLLTEITRGGRSSAFMLAWFWHKAEVSGATAIPSGNRGTCTVLASTPPRVLASFPREGT